MSKSKNCPVFSTIISFVLPKVTPEAKRALEAAIKQTSLETDAFPRSGNFTAYSLDELARSSAKAERRADIPGEWAFTYSTMQGRRVDDIIYVALMHASSWVFPPTARTDTKGDGTPKMQTHEAQREKWIKALGFDRTEITKDGKVVGRRTLFGDAFSELKDQLEKEIPERFYGTEKPASTKQMLPLVAPASLGAVTLRYNAYRKSASADNILYDVKVLSIFLLNGWTFPTSDEGVVEGDLPAFYAVECEKHILALREAEAAKQQTPEAAAA